MPGAAGGRPVTPFLPARGGSIGGEGAGRPGDSGGDSYASSCGVDPGARRAGLPDRRRRRRGTGEVADRRDPGSAAVRGRLRAGHSGERPRCGGDDGPDRGDGGGERAAGCRAGRPCGERRPSRAGVAADPTAHLRQSDARHHADGGRADDRHRPSAEVPGLGGRGRSDLPRRQRPGVPRRPPRQRGPRRGASAGRRRARDAGRRHHRALASTQPARPLAGPTLVDRRSRKRRSVRTIEGRRR